MTAGEHSRLIDTHANVCTMQEEAVPWSWSTLFPLPSHSDAVKAAGEARGPEDMLLQPSQSLATGMQGRETEGVQREGGRKWWLSEGN